ncbi:MAG: hypothetical protein ACI9SP_002441 [Arenicella sp.]|jgi:hypothetical protein
MSVMLFRDDPSLFKISVTKFSRYSRKLVLAFFLIILSTQTALGARAVSSERVAAALAAINMILLGEEPPIDEPVGDRFDIALSQQIPGPITVSDSAYAAFDRQKVGVEFCLDISANQAIQGGDIIVEINGERATVFEGKDNCYSLSVEQQRSINYIVIRTVMPGLVLTLTRVELGSQRQRQLSLPRLTRGQWNERAVRKVLKIFAFGGHAKDTQILEWADLRPQEAVVEMLNFAEHNLKLSPLADGEIYTDTQSDHGTLLGFQKFISSTSSNLPIPVNNRDQYGLDGYNFDDAYGRMITVRGLNPFRQKIGFWETNYHLAVNRDAGVSRAQVADYYDKIMTAHEAGLPYHEVIGVAAKSAAVADQYGHDRNQWVFDRNRNEFFLRGNDDFAREIHQLFYGIFGVDDPNHEDGTIRETAKMLTDMPIQNEIVVNFGTSRHHTANLTILGQTVSGANASEKIDSLMPISIEHPESLLNLPVMIISVLADDNLDVLSAKQLRNSWASMGSDKNLLRFVQAYAISSLFHSNNQFKYLTSHERALYMANKNNLDNLEAYFGGASYSGRAGRSVGGVVSNDIAGEFFRPLHNVFGAQSALEASDSALAFENNYNLLTDEEYRQRDAVQCSRCDQGQPWEKKWKDVLPTRSDGQYHVADVAEWLWNHAVGNLDNYTDLEKAHVYSLLGAARINPGSSSDGDYPLDFNFLMCIAENYQLRESTNTAQLNFILLGDRWDDYCRINDENTSGFTAAEKEALNRVYTGQSIGNNALAQDLLTQLGAMTLPLQATTGSNGGDDVREHTLERINNALGFIFTTPFVFAEGQ